MADIQKLWEGRLSRAQKVHEEWAKQFKVEMARQYFAGKQNPGYPQDEWITINKIYSHLMAQLPTLYSIDPYFYVKVKKSYTPDPDQIAIFEQRGKIRQAMLNYLKGELKLKSKARLSIQDAHFAYGVMKVHYTADEQENAKAGEQILGDDENPLLDDDGEPLLQPETIPVNKRYNITRTHPDDFIWSGDAGPLEDKWEWVAERVRVSMDEAKQDKRFNKRFLNSIKPRNKDEDKKGILNKARSFFNGADEPKKETDVVVYWEIYDIKKQQWLVISEDADGPLIDPSPLPPGTEDHPYGILRFTMQDDSPYPIPPLSQGIDPQKEYNLARSRIMTHRKRFNRKYTIIRAMLETEDEASKLENGDDGTLIFANNHGAVEPIQDAQLDQQSYTEIGMLNNDLVEVLGSPDQSRGIADADSATEASILDNRLEVREGDRLSTVIDFVTDVAKKLDMLIQAHISQDEAVKITGPEGEFWQTVKETDYEQIAGEFEYTVNAGASQPRLPDIERSQWIAFLSQVVIPFPHILTAPSVMKRMAEMFHIEDENALEEFRQLGMKIMSGEMPTPGNQGGGPPGGSAESQTIGSALGALGGNNNGGGAETVQ